MVTEQNIDELEKLLRTFKGIVKKLNILNQMNWQVQVKIPFTGETITHNIPDVKRQQIIQDAIAKRNALKTKIDSIDWTSLN